MRHGAPRIAAVAVLALVLGACGQKPGVYVAGSGDEDLQTGGSTVAAQDGGDGSEDLAGSEGGDEFAFDDGSSDETAGGDSGDGGFVSGDPGAGGDGGSSGTSGSSTDGGQDGGTTGATGSAGDEGGSTSGSREPQGSDRTGVTDDSITFGVHAPVTGAAPLPVTSFEKSGDLYYRWTVDNGGDFLGRRKVNLIFRDDKYDPSSAVQVCRELASKAFALLGGGGTDQIQACGRFSNQANVPYFSAGVTEAGLRGLEWYFASSMSYKQQGLLLAQFVAKNHRGKKVAAILTDTPNFDDAVQGWEEGVRRQGIDYHKTLRHPKGDSSWYNSFASELRDAGVEVVYILTAPVDYIRFAQQADQQGYNPRFVGVGVSMGLNAVLGSGCPEVDKGTFFSPFPGIDWARKNEKEFFQAGQRYNAPTDDIALALWGSAKVNQALLERYDRIFGKDLTREDFRAVVEQVRGLRTGIYPELNYSPDDHFGANQVHVLQADCSVGEYKTLATFVSGF